MAKLYDKCYNVVGPPSSKDEHGLYTSFEEMTRKYSSIDVEYSFATWRDRDSLGRQLYTFVSDELVPPLLDYLMQVPAHRVPMLLEVLEIQRVSAVWANQYRLGTSGHLNPTNSSRVEWACWVSGFCAATPLVPPPQFLWNDFLWNISYKNWDSRVKH